MTEPPPPERKRRPRYAGTHPRSYAEKYKERAPDLYPEEFEKVREAGKTPAGSHVPILVEEVLAALSPRPGELAVDATIGWGGHAERLLARILPGGRLIGLDVDPLELPKTEARLRGLGFDDDVLLVRRSNFAGLEKLLAELEIPGADLVFADLGVSSMQLDDPDRGFSFKREAPLDLRMNPDRGRPAAALLAGLAEDKLRKILVENADEPHAESIARAVVSARVVAPIATTTRLADVVRDALASLPRRAREDEGDSPVQRTFQALRIAVNEELTALDAFLAALPACLRRGGRAALLTFHSGEDRRVKKAFQAGERDGVYARVARDVVRASAEERRSNPRSGPAKLRWAVRA